MKKLFDYANRYAAGSTWKEFALVKLCLCAIGVIIGLFIPGRAKKPTLAAAILVFVATYIPLMVGFLRGIKQERQA